MKKKYKESEELSYDKDDYDELLTMTCKELDFRLRNYKMVDTLLNGSTGIIVLVHNGNIISANVGDSRAVLFVRGANVSTQKRAVLKPKPISIDQVPSIDSERDRILRAGGEIRPSLCIFI